MPELRRDWRLVPQSAYGVAHQGAEHFDANHVYVAFDPITHHSVPNVTSNEGPTNSATKVEGTNSNSATGVEGTIAIPVSSRCLQHLRRLPSDRSRTRSFSSAAVREFFVFLRMPLLGWCMWLL